MARFQKLQVWHLANEILSITYAAVTHMRGESALRDQMKRSAISVPSNITEGSERGTDAEFKLFLTYSRASNAELTSQWHTALSCGLVDPQLAVDTLRKLDHCGRMLSKFIQRLAG